MVGEKEMIKDLKRYAQKESIPTVHDDTIEYITNFLISHEIETVLELGTGIGYSAIMMALACPNLKVTSIEKDEERYLEAIKNIKKFNLEDRITLIFNDISDVTLDESFDFLFIDAAKGQNTKFFQQFEKNLNKSSYVITDNIYFHGYFDKAIEDIENKNIRDLVCKIKDYHQFLKDYENFDTKFIDVGEGISFSSKK